MKIQTVVSFACVSALALGVSGCGGDPEPIVTQTPSPSASVTGEASPSASPSPSDGGELSDEELAELLPDEALADDIFGAEATALFFLEQYAPMFHTGDTEVWEALSEPGCDYCSDSTGIAERLHRDGMRGKGGEITPNSGPHDVVLGPNGEVYVVVVAEVAEPITVAPDGGESVSGEASTTEFSLQLVEQGGLWRVAGVKFEVLT